MTSNYTHWLTKKEAAMYLKLSVRSIEHLIKNGLLQAHKLGGRVLLDIKENFAINHFAKSIIDYILSLCAQKNLHDTEFNNIS